MKIHVGDALSVLRKMESDSVDCVVTSPPYFGLRDYQTARWRGGDPDCDHTATANRANRARNGLTGGLATIEAATIYKQTCGKCGATRIDKQIGLEKTPDQFVSALADVFDQVYRVLKPEGTLWLNLGDSYATGGGKVGDCPGGGKQGERFRGINGPSAKDAKGLVRTFSQPNRMPLPGLKSKDLIGIPWRVAFELQKRGWFLRSDIIWHKPNPMPESVTDRPTKSHEYLFLLTKSERYFYDHEAVKEPAKFPEGSWGSTKKLDCPQYRSFYGEGRRWTGGPTRNRRTVWTVSTRPFKGAHFATFPPKLIEPCILAGCPKGGTVLDPFAGAGTTGLVAIEHGRRFVGIELNAQYAQMARDRITKGALPQRLAA